MGWHWHRHAHQHYDPLSHHTMLLCTNWKSFINDTNWNSWIPYGACLQPHSRTEPIPFKKMGKPEDTYPNKKNKDTTDGTVTLDGGICSTGTNCPGKTSSGHSSNTYTTASPTDHAYNHSQNSDSQTPGQSPGSLRASRRHLPGDMAHSADS